MLVPGLWRLGIAAVVIGIAVTEPGVHLVIWLLALIYVGPGVVFLVAAVRARGKPALRFDAEGILGSDGSVRQPWSHVVSLVVARSSRRVNLGPRSMAVLCYSQGGIDFARRAHIRVYAHRAISVPTPVSAETLAALLRSRTDVPVVVDVPPRSSGASLQRKG